jgi:hypothetical protein
LSITDSKTFKRLQEYKVDFAYSKNIFYSAVSRLEKEQNRYLKWKKIIDVAILIFSLASFSSAIHPDIPNFVLGIFAFFAFGLSVFQFINFKDFSQIKDYKNTADDYLILYKSCKNVIVKAEDGILDKNKLSEEMDKLLNTQSELIKVSPKTEYSDYLEAKKEIKEGSSGYTEEEIKNT